MLLEIKPLNTDWQLQGAILFKGFFINVWKTDIVAGYYMLCKVFTQPTITRKINDLEFQCKEVAGNWDKEHLVDVKAVGAFGRLTLAGREGDVEEAAAAAMRAIESINCNCSSR